MARCSKCGRDAASGSEYCCAGCANWDNGVHTKECHQRTFPDWDGAQYLDDPDAAVKIMERTQKALILANLLGREFHLIQEAGKRWVPNFPNALDAMLQHLQSDIHFCEREARKLLES